MAAAVKWRAGHARPLPGGAKGKLSGRGAYVCKNVDCLKKARKKRAFERAFGMQIEDSVYTRMEEEIHNAQ